MSGLLMFVIYKHPLDFPSHYVVRRCRVAEGVTEMDRGAHLAKTAEEARTLVPPGLYRLPRFHDDDPAVLEVWL